MYLDAIDGLGKIVIKVETNLANQLYNISVEACPAFEDVHAAKIEYVL